MDVNIEQKEFKMKLSMVTVVCLPPNTSINATLMVFEKAVR